ncbi:MAG: hypothetical protein GX660_18555 [Clostridiaceae bacterium]|nr:hypothetical protein [Clostridiaceae bacterium]
MSLTISQTYAKIGIETTPARLDMSTRLAKLELKQKPAKVNIETELPKVLIDQHEAFESTGLKNALEITREAAQRGMESALQYTGKVAEDGDTLAAIENGYDAIASIAERDLIQVYEWNIDFIPKTGPKFEVTGSINIEAERNWEEANNSVETKFIPHSLKVDYTPGQVEIFLRQYASVNISYQDSKLDTKV